MSHRRGLPEQLLLDSAASLRIADRIVRELNQSEPINIDDEASSSALPGVLLRAYMEIISIVDSLRRSRSMLESNAVQRLHRANEQLREVSSATEVAATDMLDGLDRALALVDRLDGEDGAPSETHVALREEIHRVIDRLQFQDIAKQQLGYASTVLQDLDRRLDALVHLIDNSLPTRSDVEPMAADAASAPYDPEASERGATERQAVADEIFIRSVAS